MTIPSQFDNHHKLRVVSNNYTTGITYYNSAGKLASPNKVNKVSSVNRTKLDVDNDKTRGFKLTDQHRVNRRQATFLIEDPRGFKVELSPENIALITESCAIGPQSIIQDECVYAFDRNNVWLLPVSSQEYKNMSAAQNIGYAGTREFAPGKIFLYKNSYPCMFIGRYKIHINKSTYFNNSTNGKTSNVFVFLREGKFFYVKTINKKFVIEDQSISLAASETSKLKALYQESVSNRIQEFEKNNAILIGKTKFQKFTYDIINSAGTIGCQQIQHYYRNPHISPTYQYNNAYFIENNRIYKTMSSGIYELVVINNIVCHRNMGRTRDLSQAAVTTITNIKSLYSDGSAYNIMTNNYWDAPMKFDFLDKNDSIIYQMK